MRKRMPRLEWLRYSAFILLYPLGSVAEIGVIQATIAHMTEPSKYKFAYPVYEVNSSKFLLIYCEDLIIFNLLNCYWYSASYRGPCSFKKYLEIKFFQ